VKRRVLVLSGPNLQLLGTREPEIYGTTTLPQIHRELVKAGKARGAKVECRQSNHEGDLVDWIGKARGKFDAMLINAGAYTHTSIALRDAIKGGGVPCVEVHLSNPEARESFRRRSRIAPVCVAKVAGFGAASYRVALYAVLEWLDGLDLVERVERVDARATVR
jgi:3-dehydroquinate dehydratase-2